MTFMQTLKEFRLRVKLVKLEAKICACSRSIAKARKNQERLTKKMEAAREELKAMSIGAMQLYK